MSNKHDNRDKVNEPEPIKDNDIEVNDVYDEENADAEAARILLRKRLMRWKH